MLRVRACLVAAVLVLVVVAGPGAADEGNLSFVIQTNIKALADPEPRVRERAAGALARIGPAAVPALIAALRNREPLVRGNAAWALAEIGPAAAPAVKRLIEALADPEPKVRENAAWALAERHAS